MTLGYLRQADIVTQNINLRYQVNKPIGIFRSYYFFLNQERDWSYGMENTYNEIRLHGSAKFNNLWRIHADFETNFNLFDTRELRGGLFTQKR